ncbi:uncharacterized protein LOC114579364 [Dendrobium catenatum]|uniref:Uncharacterized protein n=1 Tax=Dendrobium catenatum TaxID=906689 RepID=A0A2I0X4L1_9ASPA|nr:uncharacterized protein LOC114579364 [Dendrobium catenatum]PKU82842.1 hypothetical protein MA16_Dca006140 [Dendrobium catenatum]
MPSSSSSSSSYVNLHKWAESDAEFVKSLYSAGFSNKQVVVDSFSCRQLYLRSYTFSKKETMPEKTIKCFGSFKRKAIDHLACFLNETSDGNGSFSSGKEYKRKIILKKKKKCSVFFIFHRLLSCKGSFDFFVGRPHGAVVHAL